MTNRPQLVIGSVHFLTGMVAGAKHFADLHACAATEQTPMQPPYSEARQIHGTNAPSLPISRRNPSACSHHWVSRYMTAHLPPAVGHVGSFQPLTSKSLCNESRINPINRTPESYDWPVGSGFGPIDLPRVWGITYNLNNTSSQKIPLQTRPVVQCNMSGL